MAVLWLFRFRFVSDRSVLLGPLWLLVLVDALAVSALVLSDVLVVPAFVLTDTLVVSAFDVVSSGN